MWPVRFMLMACSSLLVVVCAGAVHHHRLCAGKRNSVDGPVFGPTLANSINKFLKAKWDPSLNSSTRWATTATIDGLTDADVTSTLGNLKLEMKNITVTGFSSVNVTNVHVNSGSNEIKTHFTISVNFTEISCLANYVVNGTRKKHRYEGDGLLAANITGLTAKIKLMMTLTENLEYWNLTKVKIGQKYVTTANKTLNFGHELLDELSVEDFENLKDQITARIEVQFIKHLRREIETFLGEFLPKFRWFVIIMGNFDPDDYELYLRPL